MKKWQDVTVEHYQALYPVITNPKLPEWEKEMQVVQILYDLTEKQLDSMPLDQYKELKKSCSFLFQPVPATKPPSVIWGTKRKYSLITDVRKMPFARYAEIKSFTGNNDGDFIKNLHLLIASMVQPMRWVLGVWVKEAYDATKHELYAEDLLGAKFTDVYSASVFFYLLFTYSIKAIPDYMISQMRAMNPENPEEQYRLLISTLDGFITQNRWPNLSPYQLKRLGISQPSTP